MTYYVYKTMSGQLELSDSYCPHVLKIEAKTIAAAKSLLTKYKKTLTDNGNTRSK